MPTRRALVTSRAIVALAMLLGLLTTSAEARAGSSVDPCAGSGMSVQQLPGCPAVRSLADEPEYSGPAAVSAASALASAWRWSDGAWRPATRVGGEQVWAQPYADGWTWTWTDRAGWLALRASDLVATAARVDGGRTTMDLSGPYRSDGRFLRDRHGRAIFLHGINAVWKYPPYYPPSSIFGEPRETSYFDERDARFLARSGFNSVRLGVLWAGVEPQVNRFDDTYLERTGAITRMLGEHDISVLVDTHQDQYTEVYRGEGFPDWARLDHGIRPINCCPFPLNSFMPSIRQAWQDLWDNRAGLWGQYRDAWVHIADHYRTYDNIVGYELINEPFPDRTWLSCSIGRGCVDFDTRKLQGMQEHLIAGIRTVDDTTPIWWEGNATSVFGSPNNVGAVTPIRDPAGNTVLSFHAYCLLGGVLPFLSRAADPTCPVTQRRVFTTQLAAGARNRSAPVLTEFGASDDPVDIARMAALADANMTSWYYWHHASWRDPTGVPAEQGLFVDDLQRPDTLKPAKADVLIRPYPQAVAGTPLGFSFAADALDRRFTLRYRTDPSIDAPTVIYLPVDRHYAGGYVASVSGPGRITSTRGAGLLTIETTGDGEVVVDVRRAGATAARAS